MEIQIWMMRLMLNKEHRIPMKSLCYKTHPRFFLSKFNSKWKIGRRWLYWSKPPGGPIIGVVKYEACEEFKLGGVCSRTWGGNGCSTIQFSSVKQHEKSKDHKWSCQRWFAKHYPSTNLHVAFIESGLQTMVDREKGRILTVMKLLYFFSSDNHYLLTLISANFTCT